MSLTLDDPVQGIDRRVASRRFRHDGDPAWEVLEQAFGIHSVGDLLRHYPRRYIDRQRVGSIRELHIGDHVTVIGRVVEVKRRITRRRSLKMVTVKINDGTGNLVLPFFNQPWIASQYREGMEVAVSGIVGRYGRQLQLQNQQIEILRSEDDLVHTRRITPVHPATEGVSSRTIRELVYRALDRLPKMPEPMPSVLVRAEGLAVYDRAIRDIHFPESPAELDHARERLKFDELFTLELGVAFRKHRLESEQRGVAHAADGSLTRRLLETIPFEPTNAQVRAVGQIGSAMAKPRPMHVLLQGDVGAGKTLVALHAALVAVQSGHQAAIMAPTEVLSGQHFRSLSQLLAGVGGVAFRAGTGETADDQLSLLGPARAGGREQAVRFALLTSAVSAKDRRRILEAAANGHLDVVVGTHALVQQDVTFADLSLAVVDEQHRFGLHQRTALSSKGVEPDVLIMTATPIPRTLALTYYGDLDVVVLDELPGGRQPIETAVVRTDIERARAYDVVRREVESGRQAFVVCAAIDEQNKLQVRAAEREGERLATDVFPDLQVAVLHGRMRPAEKDATMEAFRAGKSHILISTTVVEVGVDVPNATVMLIENAERFGLAQLHQLRGRIGRGTNQSFCFLFDGSDGQNIEARQRLAAMVRTTDGFELADEDLRLRGEGTLFDVRQSGMPDLKLARLSYDLELVKRARARAFAMIEEDADLDRHPELLAELRARFASSIDWLFMN